MVSICPYSEILEARKGTFQQSTLHAFFKKKKREGPQPGTSSEKSNLWITPWSKGSVQVPYSVAYRIFWSGLRTYLNNVQNLIFLFH